MTIALLLAVPLFGFSNQLPPERSRRWAGMQGLAAGLMGAAGICGGFTADRPLLRALYGVLVGGVILRLTHLPGQTRRRLESSKQVA